MISVDQLLMLCSVALTIKPIVYNYYSLQIYLAKVVGFSTKYIPLGGLRKLQILAVTIDPLIPYYDHST